MTLGLRAERAWRRTKARLTAIALAPLHLLAELAKWLYVAARCGRVEGEGRRGRPRAAPELSACLLPPLPACCLPACLPYPMCLLPLPACLIVRAAQARCTLPAPCCPCRLLVLDRIEASGRLAAQEREQRERAVAAAGAGSVPDPPARAAGEGGPTAVQPAAAPALAAAAPVGTTAAAAASSAAGSSTGLSRRAGMASSQEAPESVRAAAHAVEPAHPRRKKDD